MNENVSQDSAKMLIGPLNSQFEQVIKQELHVDRNLECNKDFQEYYGEIPKEEICEDILEESREEYKSIKLEKIIAEDDEHISKKPKQGESDKKCIIKHEELIIKDEYKQNRSGTIENMNLTLTTAVKTEIEISGSDANVESFEFIKKPNEEMSDKESLDGFSSIKHEELVIKDEQTRNSSDQAEIIFKCDQCDYQTIRKSNLKLHIPIHKKAGEAIMYKCYQCDYQTIRKTSLQRHLKIHKRPEEIIMYNCDQCNYQTKWKHGLKNHYNVHKKLEETIMYRCNQCDHQTNQKYYLKQHYLVHKIPEETLMYRCDQCDHQTIRKEHMRSHSLIHKKPEEISMYKCRQCGFKSKWRSNLMSHYLVHKNPEETIKYNCDQCDYQTIRKWSIKRHCISHKKQD